MTLTVTKAGTGTVTGQGIDGGSDCTEDLVANTQVTLTATATTGATFKGWSGDCTGTNATATVTLDKAKSCTATFEQATPEAVVTIYKDCKYGGYRVDLTPGSYTSSMLIDKGMKDNDISAIVIPAGLTATFYEDDNF